MLKQFRQGSAPHQQNQECSPPGPVQFFFSTPSDEASVGTPLGTPSDEASVGTPLGTAHPSVTTRLSLGLIIKSELGTSLSQ
jgi:hypothetical protein